MKQHFLYLTILSLFIFTATSCSKDDDEYNADTALSYYKPQVYEQIISSIEIKSTIEDKEHSWKQNFIYDAQNRIKEINGNARYYAIYTKKGKEYKSWIDRTHSSKYYYDNETLKIEYSSNELILNENVSIPHGRTFYGAFDKEKGILDSFDSFDCRYEGLMLSSVHTDHGTDYGIAFGLEYDRHQNLIKTYQLDNLENPIEKTIKEYKYSNHKNKTNIDFASFLGYNIAERNINVNGQVNNPHPYELFYLGAFEMLGGRSTYLPKGDWTFDENGFPVTYISPEEYSADETNEDGTPKLISPKRTYIITYKK